MSQNFDRALFQKIWTDPIGITVSNKLDCPNPDTDLIPSDVNNEWGKLIVPFMKRNKIKQSDMAAGPMYKQTCLEQPPFCRSRDDLLR